MELKIPPAVITIFFAVVMWLIDYYLGIGRIAADIFPWLSLFFLGAGGLWGLVGLIQFYRNSTSIDPHKPGKTSTLVTGGIFRISRNPMYVGLLFILAGYGFYLGNLLTLLVLPLFVVYMNRYQIIPEEEVLNKKFGTQFEQYRVEVRRWL